MSYITIPSFDISAYRNEAIAEGVAGIYNPCKTILNEHRPVCTKEYHLTGKYLDGADNPDVWFPIPGVGGGTVVYDTRFLTLTSGTGETSATRCVIDQTKFPITGNFIEATVSIGASGNGEGGADRRIVFGFQPSFSQTFGGGADRAIFAKNGAGIWTVRTKTDTVSLSDLPLGRNVLPGDICTVRLGRQEGSADIDIVRFYVNGHKQFESTGVPTADCYAGIGAFGVEALTTGISISIDYFGVRYVP